MRVKLADAAATEEFARHFAACLPERTAGWIVLLTGELGSGKSTFARALIRGLGHPGVVPSPTYTLIEPYDVAGGRVYHLDLYRVASEDELYFLGYDELDDGLRLIEWPERAPRTGTGADVRLTFHYGGPGRTLDVEGLSPRGRKLIACLGRATQA